VPYINQAGGGGTGAISGVIVSGAGAAGKVPVASSAAAGTWAFPPGFEINYTQITAGVNIVSTTEATGTTIISPGAITFDGSLVMVEFFCYLLETGTTSASEVCVSLFEGATQIARLAFVQTPAAVQLFVPVYGLLRFTPSAASHTYTVTAFTTNATGTPKVAAGAGGTATDSPAFVRFVKV
jgi:hypothetical protein